MAVQFLEDAKSIAEVGLDSLPAVEAVIVFGMLPVGQGQFIDAQARCGTLRAALRMASARGLPLGKNAEVLGATFAEDFRASQGFQSALPTAGRYA
jgi:hypothetical protein